MAKTLAIDLCDTSHLFLFIYFYLFLPENLTHNHSKYLEQNLAYEKFEGFFPLNHAHLSFGK